jgi:hypothetical protein
MQTWACGTLLVGVVDSGRDFSPSDVRAEIAIGSYHLESCRQPVETTNAPHDRHRRPTIPRSPCGAHRCTIRWHRVCGSGATLRAMFDPQGNCLRGAVEDIFVQFALLLRVEDSADRTCWRYSMAGGKGGVTW